jgi:hypothetical protein
MGSAKGVSRVEIVVGCVGFVVGCVGFVSGRLDCRWR